MLRSMFSGVSGLRSHQTMMDVIGNNIANVNTVGYKSSSTVFTDLLSQVISGAGLATAQQGGTNPAAVGLGVKVAGVSTDFTQGAAQLTGRALDLSISGDGFFVVERGGQLLYSRNGSLSFDALGRLVTSDGAILQGWSADGAGVIDTNGPVGNLTMPLGQTIEPSATTEITIGGNLDATPIPAGGDDITVTTSIEIFDALGTPINLTLNYVKDAATNEWSLSVVDPNDDEVANFPLPFVDGQLDPAALPLTFDPTAALPDYNWGALTEITINPGEAGAAGAVTSFSGANGIQALSQTGSALGSLQSFTIGADGVVTGVFSNGRNRALGRLALANFANPIGLEKVGDSMYRESVNSGLPQVGVPGDGGRGTLSGSTLEMSNVDLAREFTNLIVAQRGFQANSRVISASDELLQDLVNLKR